MSKKFALEKLPFAVIVYVANKVNPYWTRERLEKINHKSNLNMLFAIATSEGRSRGMEIYKTLMEMGAIGAAEEFADYEGLKI